ncbi:MAG: PIN domain-containing protein [Acetobacteraceae bacterium]
MTLVDTSVWIDHWHASDQTLARLLNERSVLGHPFVVGEVAMGSLRGRDQVLTDMRRLPQAAVARRDEVLGFIERHRLFGLGMGYVDAHLIAATRLTPGAVLWTRDRRLHDAADRLGVAMRAD